MRALLGLALFAVPAAAVLDIEREDYKIVGWNNACSVAVERYAYPKLGEAIYGEPVTTRVGTLSVLSGVPITVTRWVLEVEGLSTFNPLAIDRIRKQFKKAGYDRPGFSETIRDAATADDPRVRGVLLSTATLEARPDAWPGPEWRLGQAHYNPLTTCALLIYEKIGERERFKFLLTRIYNPSARSERARAHTTNGRLLFNSGDLEGALAEVEIGAKLAPEVGATHYHYAAMLALSGRLEEAVAELAAAIKRDPRFAAKAADDLDFDALRPRDDFRSLIEKRP